MVGERRKNMKLAIKCQRPPVNAGDAGKPDLIFIHGTGSNSKMWDKQTRFFLERGHTCFSIDLRGHGDSPEPFEKTDLMVHMTDTIDTISDAGIKFPAHFIGHSLGAIISLRLAKDRPKLVNNIFAVGVPVKVLKPFVPAIHFLISGPLQIFRLTGLHKLFAWRERTLFEMKAFTLRQILSNFVDTDLTGWLAEVKQPIHFACGRFDPVAVYLFTLKTHKKLPNSTLTMFEWGGHNFMDARPEQFNNWILGHMNDSQACLNNSEIELISP
jgi:pimeloyl-ACP methyl ester carboxylesterase